LTISFLRKKQKVQLKTEAKVSLAHASQQPCFDQDGRNGAESLETTRSGEEARQFHISQGN